MAASMAHAAPPVTPLARPIRLAGATALTDADAAARLHPLYEGGIQRVPRGAMVYRGLPFHPPGEDTSRRWVPLDESVRIDLDGVAATWLVLLHFCDAWRDPDGLRPEGAPVGWVVPVGEALLQAVVTRADGSRIVTTLRRRFEVNEGIIGWGSMAFLALPHLVESPLDWRGPHPRQDPGRYAAAGHAGPLTILPGTWGGAQTGVTDNVPSATDELMLWLYPLDVRGPDGAASRLEAIEFSPLPGEGRGRSVILAAITAFSGPSSPLRWLPRRAYRVSGSVPVALGVDMGLIARRTSLTPIAHDGSVVGWGVGDRAKGPSHELVELTAAADATLRVGEHIVTLAALEASKEAVAIGPSRIQVLEPLDDRVDVVIRASDGRPAAARVRVTAADGRVLAPVGHRLEVNPAIAEDLGADVILSGAQYAYVPSEFSIDIPAAGATIEVVHGPAITPLRLILEEGRGSGPLDVRLQAPVALDGGGWVSGDTHVHFLAPSTALLQAQAEGVNVVHLLATSWGDHHTSMTDLGADLSDEANEHVVWVGSENRQNMLGHIGIVGTRRPVFPFASGGPPEGSIGAPVSHLIADWLRTCRELGGLAVGAHFPLPMAEIAADIDAGLVDALELQCFDDTLQSPPLAEWYRYLDAGYRLPLVGGTDKMSAAIPMGQIRTYARLEDGATLDFRAWAAAIRAGRTFVTSGPLLQLRVEDREPGDELLLSGAATLEVELRAVAAQPIIEGLEIVLDGSVVAAHRCEPTTESVLRERIPVARSGWIAGRSRSSVVIGSAFASAMAAHTSALYLQVAGRPQPVPDMAVPLALVDGTRAWLEALAPLRDPQDAARFRRFLDEAERRLRQRGA